MMLLKILLFTRFWYKIINNSYKHYDNPYLYNNISISNNYTKNKW